MLENINFVARTLSSGTIATLTGLSRYLEIGGIQYDFARFVDQQVSSGILNKNSSWTIAWDLYSSKLDKN